MGSSYFGEANIERGASGGSSSCSSSSSSRKGKKKNSNSEKQPRQPQRGLGVAQLEKIRLHSQMAYAYHHRLSSYPSSSTFNNINDDPRAQMAAYSSPPSSSFSYSSSSTSYSPSYAFQTNITMGLTEYEKTNMRYGDSRSTNTARWENSNAGMLENQFSSQSKVTIPFQFLNLYGSHDDIDRGKQRSGSVGSGSHNSESSEAQELDLELRLSL